MTAIIVSAYRWDFGVGMVLSPENVATYWAFHCKLEVEPSACWDGVRRSRWQGRVADG